MAVTYSIHALDYVIFVAVLLVTIAIGIYHAFAGGRQSTTSEYLLGDRNLNWFPVSISMTASFFSSILMLGFPAETYTNGGMYWLYAIGIAIGAILSVLIFVPVIHPLKLTSVNDYLYMRYNSRFVAICGTLSSVTGMLLYTSIVYFSPATAAERITGLPTWAWILIFSGITIIYTSIGGIKAVIWTDVFQAALMLAGLLAISITAIMKVGGTSNVWEICEEWGRMNIIDLNPDPTIRFTFWSLTIGVGFFDLNRYGSQQTAVQRYGSLKTITQARLCVLGLIPWTAITTFLASLSGLTIFAYYTKLGCDPLRAGYITNANQLVPHFVADTLNYPGMQGILIASVVAASLSTASSALNSSSANVWKDVICQIWPNLPEKRNVVATKLLVVVFGVVSTGLAFLLINLGGTVVQMVITFMGATGGPTTAMFLLGFFCPFTNWIGAIAGGFTGFGFALLIGFGSYSINVQRQYLPTTVENCLVNAMDNITSTLEPMTMSTTSMIYSSTMAIEPTVNPLHKLFSVSYLWIAFFSMIVTIVVGLIVSLISGRMGGVAVPAKLLHPWIWRFCKLDDSEDDVSFVKPTENGIEKFHDNDNLPMCDGYEKPGIIQSTKL